jgi:hypothetical protein
MPRPEITSVIAGRMLGVRLDADQAEINAAFIKLSEDLDLSSADGRERLARLQRARRLLLADGSTEAQESKNADDVITIDPADIVEVPAPNTPPSTSRSVVRRRREPRRPLDGASALRDFLDNDVAVHERMGAPLPSEVLTWAMLAAIGTMLSGLAFMVGSDIKGYANLEGPGTALLVLSVALLLAALGLRAVRGLPGRFLAIAYLTVASLGALPAAALLLAAALVLAGTLVAGIASAIIGYWILVIVLAIIANS